MPRPRIRILGCRSERSTPSRHASAQTSAHPCTVDSDNCASRPSVFSRLLLLVRHSRLLSPHAALLCQASLVPPREPFLALRQYSAYRFFFFFKHRPPPDIPPFPHLDHLPT